MPVISLLGFRGVGRNPDYSDEELLIILEHVGICFEGDDTIYGFHPSPDSIAAAGGKEAFTEQLKNHEVKDGYIFDDRDIFHRARSLAKGGARCRVWKTPYSYNDDEFEQIREQFLKAYREKKPYLYSLPPKEGVMQDDRDNCATFPRKFGITIPEQTGNLIDYLPALVMAGGGEWNPEED